MFDLGWTEMLLVGIVALIVVGPKDLPGMFRAVGQFTGKAKAMAREFTRAMNDAADQSGVSEIEKTIRAASNPKKFGTDSIRKAAGSGSSEQALSPERQAAKDKISAATAKKAEERRAAEEAAAEEEEDDLLLDEDLAPPAEQPRQEGAKPDPQAPEPPEREPAAEPASEDEAESSRT